MFGGFFKSVVKSADEVLFSGVKVRSLGCFRKVLVSWEYMSFLWRRGVFINQVLNIS